MENTVPHPAPRQRTVRHRSALAITPARRGAGAGGGRDEAGRGRPTDRREQTAAPVPGGCDHAYTDPDALAIARARDERDKRLSGGKSRRARAWARRPGPRACTPARRGRAPPRAATPRVARAGAGA